MRRLLFISSYSGLGGGETSTLTLAQQLTDIEPHLLIPSEGAFSRAWAAKGWPVHIVPFRGASTYFEPHLWGMLPPRNRLTDIIKTHQIDLLHAEYHSLPMAAAAAHATNTPIVWTVMGWWFRPKRWQRAFFQQFPITFAHSQAIKDGFLGNPPFMSSHNVRVLYPSVDVERFHPRNNGHTIRAELGLADDMPLVVMIGRYQSVKGHDRFVQVAWLVGRRVEQAHFLIVGGNPQTPADHAYRDRVQAMIEREHYMAHRFHLWQHRNDIPDILAAADVVVCPSEFESFGVVNVEAMASGKPVVSTNNGGPREVVVDGVTGYLVAPDDPITFSQRIIELLYSAQLRRSMGAAGRLRATQTFSAQAAAQIFTNALP